MREEGGGGFASDMTRDLFGGYDVTDPYSAGFTSRVHNGPRDYDLSFSFGFTLKPTSAVSSREYRAGAVLES